MNRQSIIYILTATLILTAASWPAEISQREASSKVLKINILDSKIIWKGKKPGGEHTGYVKLSRGEVTLDKNEITGGSFIIDLNTITDLDLKDQSLNNRLVDFLKSADFFNTKKYPTAGFVITKVSKLPAAVAGDSKATHLIEGDLSIRDITRKISFRASVNMLNGRLAASAMPFTIDRTQWGVNYQSRSVFKELKDQFIDDDITLSLDLVSN